MLRRTTRATAAAGRLLGCAAGRPAGNPAGRLVRRPVGRPGPARALASLAGVADLAPGTALHGFTVLRTKAVPELELTAVHLQHARTGAQHLHVARDDANNVFSIGFRTNPPDATGVPHILEHTTLCGSRQFPVRDPFFKMLPRTLSNFMNAFTAADHTFYPFATTNAQDYQNLLAVYLDATLHPLLQETDFAQEGWRVGLEGQPPAPAFKGVVYNEMKGQMSDAGYLFYVRFQDCILPALHNSGGDPQHITDLTYDQLRRFHADHYHPTNARLFTYGDLPLAAHLRAVDARLAAFDALPGGPDNHVPRPIDLAATGPQAVVVPGPPDPLVDPGRQHKTSVTWVAGDTAADPVESFALGLLSALLLDGYGAPLYRALIEDAALGLDWSPNTGYDGGGRVGLFSVGLTGVAAADVGRVPAAVEQALRDARARGFDRRKIDGYLHQLELGLKHKTAGFGVALLQRLLPRWFAGVDPLDALAWNDTVAAFSARLAADAGYLESLLDRYLLGRPALAFTMAPSDAYADALARDEAARLAAKVAEAAARQPDGADGGDEAARARAHIAAQEARLLAAQDAARAEDLSCLPTVHVRDIPRAPAPPVLREEALDVALATATAGTTTTTVATQWHEAPTNGLTYVRVLHALDGGRLPDDLRPLVPLFTDAVLRLGTRTQTMEQLEDRIKLHTGGVSVGYHAAASPRSSDDGGGAASASEGLLFTGMALDRHVPAMLDLLRTLVVETDFRSDAAVQHVRQLLQAASDGVVNTIAGAGHAYARRRAEAGLARSAALREQVSGLAQIRLVAELASRPAAADQLDDVLAKLQAIQQLALQAGGGPLRAAVTCGAESVPANTAALRAFVASLPGGQASAAALVPAGAETTPSTLPTAARTFVPLPFQVAYGARVVPTVAYTSPDSAALQVLAQLLTHKHLHHEIREKGGAYGGGAYAQALDGVFGCYSYRDPSPERSLQVMAEAGRWVLDASAGRGGWDARDVDEAKISVFQGVDAPRAVNEEGMGTFLYGVTAAQRQARRAQLLDVTPDQLRAVAERYLAAPAAQQAARTVLLGERPAWVDDTWAVEAMNVAA